MDYLLLLLVLTIVICMGYILSKPFIKQTVNQQDDDWKDNFSPEYQAILHEIKTLERAFSAGIITEAECSAKIEEKKIKAAYLLRMTGFAKGSEQQKDIQSNLTPEESAALEIDNPPPHGFTYCPTCGDQVLLSDKFCVHCGHRLQP